MKQQFYAKKKISSTYKNEWLKFILQEDTLWGARENKFNKLDQQPNHLVYGLFVFSNEHNTMYAKCAACNLFTQR